jgi:hypothetical protein
VLGGATVAMSRSGPASALSPHARSTSQASDTNDRDDVERARDLRVDKTWQHRIGLPSSAQTVPPHATIGRSRKR